MLRTCTTLCRPRLELKWRRRCARKEYNILYYISIGVLSMRLIMCIVLVFSKRNTPQPNAMLVYIIICCYNTLCI